MSGVILTVTSNGTPSGSYEGAGGDPATYAGHRARVTHNPDFCTGYRADLFTNVSVFRIDATNNWYQFDLCGRDPGTDVMQKEFEALLRSLTISP
jgi:hypothetical protein